jgi:hypothetical protein
LLEKVRTHFEQKSQLIATQNAAELKLNARADKKGVGRKGVLPVLTFAASFFATVIFCINEIGTPLISFRTSSL